MAEWSPPRVAGIVVGIGTMLVSAALPGNLLPCFLNTQRTPEDQARCNQEKAQTATKEATLAAGAIVLVTALFGPPLVDALKKP